MRSKPPIGVGAGESIMSLSSLKVWAVSNCVLVPLRQFGP
jgi:hypothetical protein